MLDFLIWIDIKVFWLITLGNCRPGETISAGAWSLHLAGKWQGKLFVPLINGLFFFLQKDHCRQAWLWQAEIYKD